jgi:hypothetical protein
MRKLLSLTALSLLFSATAASAASPVDGEAQLARALRGRVAGEPVSCIDLFRVRSSRVINDTAILYDAGSVIYVNRPRSGAEDLNRWDTLVTRTPSTRLCSIDTVQVVDLPSGALTGIVFLGEFVPYRRESSASRD